MTSPCKDTEHDHLIFKRFLPVTQDELKISVLPFSISVQLTSADEIVSCCSESMDIYDMCVYTHVYSTAIRVKRSRVQVTS